MDKNTQKESLRAKRFPPRAMHKLVRKDKPVHPILQGYIDLLQEARRNSRTISNNKNVLEIYQAWLDERGLDAPLVTQKEFREYQGYLQRRYKISTSRRHFITIRSMYKYATEMGWAERNPTAGLGKFIPLEQDKEPETYTAAEMRQMVASVKTEREMLLLYGLALTGLRQFELLSLKWEYENEGDSWVDFENDQLVVLGKQNKLRYVPLHPILREKLLVYRATAAGRHTRFVLQSSWGWGRMAGSTANVAVIKLLKRAGVRVPSKPSHTFRKTLNTNLTRLGVKGFVMDEIFGWAKSTVRERYYTGRSTEEARNAIQMAYQDDPVFPEQKHLEPPVALQGTSDEVIKLKLEILDLQRQLLQRELVTA